MRSRIEILIELALLQGDIGVLEKELSHYPWDTTKPLVKIDEVMLSNILKKSINNEIDFNTLSDWANAIECRDDVEFANESLHDIIFDLANPDINGKITYARLREYIILLEK